ncbi:Uncharacterized protein dnl_25870 [Desulfonema limicola]|uniref:DUF3352 domain-containing protein n=2 Tax=Desulfonema limicola TaxID=45656 RepID=A0A975B7G7_9BACT|nr:Uncharacterized protein dnl_25870 [Desulfonema limicola]
MLNYIKEKILKKRLFPLINKGFKMKNIIIIWCVVLSALAVIGFGIKYYTKPDTSVENILQITKNTKFHETQPEAIPNIIDFIPGQTDFVLNTGSVENIYKQFSITETSVFGNPVKNLDNIKTTLGFNPLVIEDLENTGIDTRGDAGFCFNGLKLDKNDEQVNLFLYLPVNDVQKVKKALFNLVKEEFSDIEVFSQKGFTVYSKPDRSKKLYLIEKGNYLFIGINPGTDALNYAEALALTEKRLSDKDEFKTVVSKLVLSKDMFIYADFKNIIENNLEAIGENLKRSLKPGSSDISKSMDYLKNIQSGGGSADFSGKDFNFKGMIEFASDSYASGLIKDLRFDKDILLGISDNPLLLASWAVHTPSYYNMVLDFMPAADSRDYKIFLEHSKAVYDIDFEKHVIDNFAGNINLGIYDGMSINMMNYNLLLTLTIKNEKLFHETAEKFILNAPPRIKSMVRTANIGDNKAWIVSVFGMVQIFITTRDNNLVLTASKPLMEKALAGDMSKGFIVNIEDKNLADRLASNSSLLYLNFGELDKALNNFSAITAMMNKGKSINTSKVLNKLDYLLSTAEIKGNGAEFGFYIKTMFDKPFFQGMLELDKDL